MKSLLNKFLKGILYILTLPLLLVALAVISVFGLFYFIGLSVKGIILFFQGKSVFKDLPEDVEVRKIKEAQAAASTNGNGTLNHNDFVLEEEPENEDTPIHIMEENRINTPVVEAKITEARYDEPITIEEPKRIEINIENTANLEENHGFSHIEDENNDGGNY